MAKTVQLYGFPSVESPESVKMFLEELTGEGTVCSVEVGRGENSPRARAEVQFTDAESAKTIISLARDRDLHWHCGSYLKARALTSAFLCSDAPVHFRGRVSEDESSVELYGFPSVESPESVKMFLEELTGEGTVCSIEVGRGKNSLRARAEVRFTNAESAKTIISLARDRDLHWHCGSYLKARALTSAFLCRVHFGGRVSEDKFSVLWTKEDVWVKFGKGLEKLYFFFSYETVEFKLELSFENIWQIEHRCPRNQSTNFLIFQLLGAPRIFRREDPDRHWTRDIDFTPSSYIGQSSALCLQIPIYHRLPSLRGGFVSYKEGERRFYLEKGSPFSSSTSDLVPMLLPPQGINLPYRILFKVNSLVQHGYLPGEAIDHKFFKLVDPTRIEPEYIEAALDKLAHLKHCCSNPLRWLTAQYNSYRKSEKIPKNSVIFLDDGLVYVHRVQITPTKIYFCGPEINLSNRVLRNYPNEIDNFLRVSFVDEDLDKLHSPALSQRGNGRTRVYYRILSVLRDGIAIGDKRFEFLGFSSSQLQESSVWMFASRDGLTAADIRKWMGEFRQIRNVAKYAARLGQSFGSSRETLRIKVHEVDSIPDIEAQRDGKKYCGYKGVVAVDPRSSMRLSLRDSMSKYASENTKHDVLAWSKYQPCFLDRQLIMLLSTLGVEDRVFITKQNEAVANLDAILTDPARARDELEVMFPSQITNLLKEMLECGYGPNEEPFLSAMLRTLRSSKLLEIRERARIFVRDGRAMMGCLDETGTLEYGQVFVQCSLRHCDRSGPERIVVEGKVAVAKNPCLHPGDLRVLTAVDVPELRHMVDCVVFPQKGMRPHPNECSGSDLDGDIYFVCWDRDLVPVRQVEAMDYTPAPTIQLDHDVTIEEVEKFFADYILDSNMGIISSAHTAFADRQPKMAKSKPCIELAKLFSIAVDFPKTGVPAKIPPHLHPKEYPDFMEKPDKQTYKSKHVIGKLYRQVKGIEDRSSAIKTFTRETAEKCYDTEMEVSGFEDYVHDALGHKSKYDYKLASLMDYYGFKTEAELLSGNVLKKSRHFNKKRDMESVNYAVRSLIKEVRALFENNGTDNQRDDYAKKASAWYHVTYHPRYWGLCNNDDEFLGREHFLSFAWCVFDRLVAIKKDKAFFTGDSPFESLFDLADEV